MNTSRYIQKNSAQWASGRKQPNAFVPSGDVFPDVRIAVYTCITGGYDNIRDPFYVDDSIDYYCFVDSVRKIPDGVRAWKFFPVPASLQQFSTAKRQRYVKLHPDEFIDGTKYDYTFYVDGSMRMTCDIKPLVYSLISAGKNIALHTHCARDCIYDEAAACFVLGKAGYSGIREQVEFYRAEGMPEHFGLTANTVIIRKTNDDELKVIMSDWWEQITRFTHRDQLSFPYVLWKNGKDISYVYSLGRNIWRNPCFLYYPHNN